MTEPRVGYCSTSPAPGCAGDPSFGRRRFTLAVIKDMLLSSYRRSNVTPEELTKMLRRIRIAEMDGNWKAFTALLWPGDAPPGDRGMGELANTVSAPGFDAEKDYEERTRRARDYAERTEPAGLSSHPSHDRIPRKPLTKQDIISDSPGRHRSAKKKPPAA
jgi:hypothetical protein